MKLRLKYGFKMLFRDPVRVAASFLAAIVALGIAGMCIFMQTYNIFPWGKELFFNYSGWRYGSDPYVGIISNRQNQYPNMYYGGHGFNRERLAETETLISEIGGYAIMYCCADIVPDSNIGVADLFEYVNETQTRFWGEYNGETLFAPFAKEPDYIEKTTPEKRARADISDYLYNTVTVYSGEDAMEAFDYTLVGALPQKKDEVAIPQWLYNSFLCYGYRAKDGKVYKIERESDIIGKEVELQYWDHGKKITPAIIVGVVHSDYESENFPGRIFTYREGTSGLTADNYGSFNGGMEYIPPPHMGVIVSKEFLLLNREENIAAQIVVPRYKEYSEKYFDLFYEAAEKKNSNEFYQVSPKYVRMASSPAVVTLDQSVRRIYNDTSIYFEIVPYLGAFAALLMIYLCFSTVMGKRRGMGILQSMGADKKQLVFTIGVPILIFCLVCSLGALFVELGILSYMNGRLWETVLELEYFFSYSALTVPHPFTLGWEVLLFTFGVPVAIAAFTTAVTVYLVFRAPVVDNLTKKEFRLIRRKKA